MIAWEDNTIYLIVTRSREEYRNYFIREGGMFGTECQEEANEGPLGT